VLVSLPNCPGEDDVKGIALTGDMFQTKRDFHIAAYAILVLLVVIYAVFWYKFSSKTLKIIDLWHIS
jgi:SSS family solute:Na+ symporter